jgi:metallo-beta-lactamase family protein
MKITILGAAGGEVTGSAYYVQANGAKLLVDFGMFQGNERTERRNAQPHGVPKDLDAVLLTHAHLDHTGRLPLLAKMGYEGPIYGTDATLDLANLIVRDSAKIQVSDARELNQRRRSEDEPLVEPLYTNAEVDALVPLAKEIFLNQPAEIAEGVSVRLVEAGHMLGSTSIEMTVLEGGTRKVVVFSGDVGSRDMPILRDAVPLENADLVVIESTYGDRDHLPYDQTIAAFEEVVLQAVAQKGKMLVPAFAVGRTQQVIYHVADMALGGRVEPFPTAIDSPMAVKATEVYREHPDLYDDEMVALVGAGMRALGEQYLYACDSVQESRALNGWQGPCMIVATSGMCTGGRILHHLRHNLPYPSTHLLIVGYQGEGTLGRELTEGAQTVTIYGDKVEVRAQIHELAGFSGHAGQTDLLRWFEPLGKRRPQVLITHGENPPRNALAAKIEQQHGIRSILPNLFDTFEL